MVTANTCFTDSVAWVTDAELNELTFPRARVLVFLLVAVFNHYAVEFESVKFLKLKV